MLFRSPALRSELDQLRGFLSERMYFHPRVLKKSTHGQGVVLSLCNTLKENPTDKVKELQQRTGSPLTEAIKDYVAGMTDSYALGQTDEL